MLFYQHGLAWEVAEFVEDWLPVSSINRDYREFFSVGRAARFLFIVLNHVFEQAHLEYEEDPFPPLR